MSSILAFAPEVAEASPPPDLLFGAVAASTALFLVPLTVKALRRLGPGLTPVAPPWQGLHVVALGFWAFAILLGAGVLAVDTGILGRLWLMVGVLGSTTVFALLLATVLPGPGFAALGIRSRGLLRAVVAGSVAYLLLLVPLLGLQWLWPHLAPWVGIEVTIQDVLTEILELEGLPLLQAVVIAVVLGPLFEETVFRGFLQPFLVHHAGPLAGIAATSLLFALLHGLAPLLPLFALSVVLGVIRHRTGHLAAAWFVHALHNGWTLLVAFQLPDWI